MRVTTLYFDTGVCMEFPREETIYCSRSLGAREDSMMDLVCYVWGPNAVSAVRRHARALARGRPAYPIFQASVDGTRELIAHLQVHCSKKEDWHHMLTAVVLHQLGYRPSLQVQFDW